VPSYGFNNLVSPYQDLKLPSGSLVQIKTLGVEDMISMGLLEQLDSLGFLVQTEHVERVKGTSKKTDRPAKKPTKAQQAAAEEKASEDAMKNLMANASGFRTMTVLIDRIVAKSLVQPKVQLAYNENVVMVEGQEPRSTFTLHTDEEAQARDTNVVWTDQIDFEDRMAIFSACMPDTDKMASFRKGSKKGLGDVAGEPEDAVSAE
jgi:hypothetical protein